MPRLRRLSGKQVFTLLSSVGFVESRVRGSHHILTFRHDVEECHVTIPIHGNEPLPPGTLKSIYRQAAVCVDEEQLRSFFYAD